MLLTVDKPLVTDLFKLLILRRQAAFETGDSVTYNSLVNRLAKRLKKNYYQHQVENLKDSNPRKWWNSVKTLSGKGHSEASTVLKPLADLHCESDMSQLASDINSFFCQYI